MKVLISERQLKRLIREFQSDLYSETFSLILRKILNYLGCDEIESVCINNIFGDMKDFPLDKNQKWDSQLVHEYETSKLNIILGEVKNIFFSVLSDYFSINDEDDQKLVNKVKSMIDTDITVENILGNKYGSILFKGRGLVKTEIASYSTFPIYVLSDARDEFNKWLNKLKSLFPNKKEDLDLNITTSKSKYGLYSGENIKDELSKQIYDWGITKNILEKLLFEFLNNEEYVSKELYTKINAEGVFNTMMNKMDKAMSSTDYKAFSLINPNNWRSDIEKFLFYYANFYKNMTKGNTKQFYEKINLEKKYPAEIFFGRLIYTMIYWINKNK